MSNLAVASQMRAVLNDARTGCLSPADAATALRGLSSALEGVSSPLAKELAGLCEELEVASWHEDEGMLSSRDETLSNLEASVARLSTHF